MPKSPDAFRTISEVAEWLGVQAHVLRFWESKFSQVKPIKRAGGRRYYRPADMLLIGGIKKLLHDDGLTIKGVQKILREQGASHVADQSQPLDDLTAAVLDAPPIPDADVIIDAEPETAEIVELTPAHAAPDPEPLQDPSPEGETITDEAPEQVASTEDDMVAVAQDTTEPETVAASAPQAAGLDDAPVSSDAEDVPQDAQPDEIPDVAPAQTDEPETLGEADSDAVPSFLRRPLQDFVELPSEPDTAIEAPPAPAEPEPEPAALKPRVIDLPPLPVESDMPAAPAALSALAKVRALSADQATALRPLLAELTQLRDQMAQHGQSPHKD